MNFCSTDISIDEANAGNTFAFSPPANPILSAEPYDLTDSSAYGNRFNRRNCAYNFKVHWVLYQFAFKLSISCLPSGMNEEQAFRRDHALLVSSVWPYRIVCCL